MIKIRYSPSLQDFVSGTAGKLVIGGALSTLAFVANAAEGLARRHKRGNHDGRNRDDDRHDRNGKDKDNDRDRDKERKDNERDREQEERHDARSSDDQGNRDNSSTESVPEKSVESAAGGDYTQPHRFVLADDPAPTNAFVRAPGFHDKNDFGFVS